MLLGTDVTVGNADAYLPYFAEGGAVQAYKQLFSLPSCQEQFAGLGVEVGAMDDRIPLDRTALAEQVERPAPPALPKARWMRATRRPIRRDISCGTRQPRHCCLCAVSSKKWGSLYPHAGRRQPELFTVELAWGWVAVLYLLLAYAALPVQGAKSCSRAGGGWCCAAAALCCLLTVAGCLLWTPIRYETLYGLQGRYFLPILPLLLLTCLPAAWPRCPMGAPRRKS